MGRKSNAKKNREGSSAGAVRRAAGGLTVQASARQVEAEARAERERRAAWQMEEAALQRLVPPPALHTEFGSMCEFNREPLARGCHWRPRGERTKCRTISDDDPELERWRVVNRNYCAKASPAYCTGRFPSLDITFGGGQPTSPRPRGARLNGLFAAALLSLIPNEKPRL